MSSGPPSKRLEQAVLSFANKPTAVAFAPEHLPFQNNIVSLNPKEDGNCLFSSISDQMKLCLCKNISPATIRSDIVQYLWDRRDSLTLLDGTTVHLSEKVSHGDVESYLHEMAQPGTFGNHMMIIGACCLYLVQFKIFTSLGDNATAVVAPNESSTTMPDLPMLLLGHIAEGKGVYYVSLVGGTIRTPPRVA